MKKKIIVGILITVIAISAIIFIYYKTTNNEKYSRTFKELTNTEGIVKLMTLEDEVTDNAIWCGTFQLIWNDLKNDLAKQDIVFTPQLKVVENLNKETFTAENLSESDYYKIYGKPTIELKNKIEKEIIEKFNETSNILNDFDWERNGDNDYFLYSMLKKEFQFEKAFKDLGTGKFKDYEDISYFGIPEHGENSALRGQIEVLYYNTEDDFAIKLETKEKEEVILCKNPEGKTFNEIYQKIDAKQYTKTEGIIGIIEDSKVKEGEIVQIPNLSISEKVEFKEIENNPFSFSNGANCYIEKAMQTIQFELDRTGGKIKSEAGMMNQEMGLPYANREFRIDDTFAIFLKEEGKATPYFAAKISDITKFQ